MISGSIVALITPMKLNGAEVDYESLQKLVEFHIKHGTDGIVAVGTTGESATLPIPEHVEVVRQTVRFAAGRIPVIGGNGANATDEAVKITQALEGAGVDAMLGVTPYYNKPSPQGLIAHYKAVAACTDVAQILYNVPGRTAVDMLPETVAELATVANIIGVKEATGDVSRVAKLRALCPADFKLYSGDDATAGQFMLAGGDGVISVVNNIAPQLFKDMSVAALNGDESQTKKLNEMLAGLSTTLFCEANPIPVKWAAHQMKLIAHGDIRLPLTQLASEYHGKLLESMSQAQIEV